MSIRNLGSRLDSLERRISVGTVDMEAEAAQYGELVWGDRTGSRCYITAFDDGECDGTRLSIVGDQGPITVYEVIGIPPEALS